MPEIRDSRRLCFYAAIFGAWAHVTEQGEIFQESITRGAFARTLTAGTDVIACIDHKPETEFSRRSTGLILQEDARGLFCSCWLPETQLGNKILADVEAKRITGASFKFYDVTEGRIRNGHKHTVTDLLFEDVCLCYGNQIYKQTTVSIRAAEKNSARLRILKLKTVGTK
ncbi:MAG: HK97 family phage prohead protease [Fimbriiglobus sp.]